MEGRSEPWRATKGITGRVFVRNPLPTPTHVVGRHLCPPLRPLKPVNNEYIEIPSNLLTPLLGLCGRPQTQEVKDNICHNQAGCPQDPGPVTEPGGTCHKNILNIASAPRPKIPEDPPPDLPPPALRSVPVKWLLLSDVLGGSPQAEKLPHEP